MTATVTDLDDEAQRILAQAPRVVVIPHLVTLAGSMRGAVVLSRLLQLLPDAAKRDESDDRLWIERPRGCWWTECCIGEKRARSELRRMQERGLLLVWHERGPAATTWVSLDLSAVHAAVIAAEQGQAS